MVVHQRIDCNWRRGRQGREAEKTHWEGKKKKKEEVLSLFTQWALSTQSNKSNIGVVPSTIWKTPTEHLFPTRRVPTLPGHNRLKEKGALRPCWLCLLALNTCSGLGHKYSSLDTCHHFWAGSSCLFHFWGAFDYDVQSGTAPRGKDTSSYSLSDGASSLEKAHVGRQTESPITCPALLWCHHYTERSRDTEKSP